MRAAVLEAANQPFVIDDTVKIDDPGPGYVRVKVSHCGICHSDLTVTHSGMATPIVLGHEGAGVVEAVGEGVTILAPGDSVVLTPIAPCGRCYFCVRGEAGLCVNNRDVLTNTFADGTTRGVRISPPRPPPPTGRGRPRCRCAWRPPARRCRPASGSSRRPGARCR